MATQGNALLDTTGKVPAANIPDISATYSVVAGDTSIATVGTIGTGTWQATDVGAAYGGTGRSSHTAYGVLCGGTTTTAAQQSIASVGTSGQVLTSNGAGALPTMQDAGGGGGNKTVWLGAGQAVAISPATYTTNSTAPYGVVVLTDAQNTTAVVSWSTPDDFSSLVSVKCYWTTTASTGNGYFAFASRALASGENMNSGGSSDSIGVTTYAYAGGAVRLVNITDVTAMANGLTISANDLISLNIERSGADGNDTLNAAVWFLGFQVVYA